MTLLVGLFALLGATQAHAEDPALACARTAAWEAASQGWSLRLLDNAELSVGGYQTWEAALLPGQTYRVIACTPVPGAFVEAGIADTSGRLVARSAQAGASAQAELTPDQAGRYLIVVHPRTGPARAHVGVVVLYK